MISTTPRIRSSFSLLMLALTVFLLAVLAGCSGPAGDPARTVEEYLEALAAKDTDRLVSLSCAAWEAGARQEAASFEAVTPTLQGVDCQQTGVDGDDRLITCEGTISVTYNDETREISLAEKTYHVVFEGGDWRVCGYQE